MDDTEREPEPAAPAPAQTTAAETIDAWINSHLRDSPVSREAEALRYLLTQAIPALKRMFEGATS